MPGGPGGLRDHARKAGRDHLPTGQHARVVAEAHHGLDRHGQVDDRSRVRREGNAGLSTGQQVDRQIRSQLVERALVTTPAEVLGRQGESMAGELHLVGAGRDRQPGHAVVSVGRTYVAGRLRLAMSGLGVGGADLVDLVGELVAQLLGGAVHDGFEVGIRDVVQRLEASGEEGIDAAGECGVLVGLVQSVAGGVGNDRRAVGVDSASEAELPHEREVSRQAQRDVELLADPRLGHAPELADLDDRLLARGQREAR
jgi:hypothetical protein